MRWCRVYVREMKVVSEDVMMSREIGFFFLFTIFRLTIVFICCVNTMQQVVKQD